jgi:uncharacterized protein (TIGR03086 family)
MNPIDLGPAAERMATLVRNIPDEALSRPTPCPDYALGDLVDHVGGFAIAFTGAAQKDAGETTAQNASGDASRLTDDWRARIPADLGRLAAAWRDGDAWTGMTRAGGVDLPGEIAGLVALDELVLHGWDVARASGQPYDVDASSLESVHGFVLGFSKPGDEASRAGLFGPVVRVPDDAPLLDQVVGLAGRDPNWTGR